MKTDYHAKYWANEITKRFSSETVEKFVQTLSEAQVKLNPHQVDVHYLHSNHLYPKGAVLTDEIGLGNHYWNYMDLSVL